MPVAAVSACESRRARFRGRGLVSSGLGNSASFVRDLADLKQVAQTRCGIPDLPVAAGSPGWGSGGRKSGERCLCDDLGCIWLSVYGRRMIISTAQGTRAGGARTLVSLTTALADLLPLLSPSR